MLMEVPWKFSVFSALTGPMERIMVDGGRFYGVAGC